jgi:hypothetical protein
LPLLKVGYQAATFDKRELNDEEKHEWGTALALNALVGIREGLCG